MNLEKVRRGKMVSKEGIYEGYKVLQNNRSWGFEESDGASVLPVIFDFCKIVPNTSGIQNIQTFLLSFSNFVHCSSLTRQEFLQNLFFSC